MAETLTLHSETVQTASLSPRLDNAGDGRGREEIELRVEIDTSAPFESVKEAVNRFGGIGFWKPSSNLKPLETQEQEEVDTAKLEEQAAQLEEDLMVKERETLDVLKELESTKIVVEELKAKLQKETSEMDAKLKMNAVNKSIDPILNEAEKENHYEVGSLNKLVGSVSCPSSAPGLILMELKQAKLNLTRTTTDLADIRGSVESLNKKLQKERIALEKTRERLNQKSSKISSLEEELSQTRLKLEMAKEAESKSLEQPADITRELHRLSSEAEQFKIVGEAAKLEVQRAISEIELTKTKIRTAEMKLRATRKMKEAAIATEAVALAEVNALSQSGGHNPEVVTLSLEEYSFLTAQAHDAEEKSKKSILDAMLKIDEANMTKSEILRRVEEATDEVKKSKKVLQEALSRVDAANNGKLAVEEALRKWRSDHGRRRRSLHNGAKFKNSYPSHRRRDSRNLDMNALNMDIEVSKPVLKPTLSIGQILSQKLLLAEDFESGKFSGKDAVKRKVSLGQMLGKQIDVPISRKPKEECGQKQFSCKRKKFGFARFSLLLAKEQKKKKPLF